MSKPSSFAWLAATVIMVLLQLFSVDKIEPYVLTIVIYAGINIILAISLNLINGFTGQFSMGHAGFMAIGAYVGGVLSITLGKYFPEINQEFITSQFVFFAVLIVSGISASIAGFIVGQPSLRLKGDYLAVVTLGFGEIIRVIILNLESVGGARGLTGIPPQTNFLWVYAVALFTAYFISRLIASPLGRSFLAVREDEIAAEAVGVNTTKSKVLAFVIGAFFAGVAGALFAHHLRYISPSIFDISKSFEIIIMVVLGGMGSISGSIVAAIFLTGIPEMLRPLEQYTKTDYRMVIYSLVLIVLMLTRPRGLFGSKEIYDFLPSRWKKYFSNNRENTQK